MEHLQTIALIVSGLSAFSALQIWFYRWAYSTGHAHGHHAGFSEGLWKAAERQAKKDRYELTSV